MHAKLANGGYGIKKKKKKVVFDISRRPSFQRIESIAIAVDILMAALRTS